MKILAMLSALTISPRKNQVYVDCGHSSSATLAFPLSLAQIYIDNELELPVRFVAYDWPEKPGDQPLLLEDYSCCNLELNVNLTDDDFQNSSLGNLFHETDLE
jgi:hypothetical protein